MPSKIMRLHDYACTKILLLLLIHQHGSEHISAGLIMLVILVLNNLEIYDHETCTLDM